MQDKKIWRTIGQIDGEIIVKESVNKMKAIKSTRNAICQRLCNLAGLPYRLGWYNGFGSSRKLEFVDRFIGETILVMNDDPVEIELHEVPYEVYTTSSISKTFANRDFLCPENIDSWGNLHFGPRNSDKFNLLGAEILIPPTESMSKKYEEEEVIAFIDAQLCIEKCPNCQSEIPFGTLAILTENYRLLPTICCSKMHWTVNNNFTYSEWE